MDPKPLAEKFCRLCQDLHRVGVDLELVLPVSRQWDPLRVALAVAEGLYFHLPALQETTKGLPAVRQLKLPLGTTAVLVGTG